MKLVLIDDNPVDTFVATKILGLNGITQNVQVFHNPVEALDFFKNDEDASADFLLVDIHMPELNGFQFVEALKEARPDVLERATLYIVSSTVDQNDLEKVEADPHIKGMIGKPLRPDQVKKYICDIYEKSTVE